MSNSSRIKFLFANPGRLSEAQGKIRRRLEKEHFHIEFQLFGEMEMADVVKDLKYYSFHNVLCID
jgi:hypothetical protein